MTPKKRQNLRRIRRFIKSAESRGYRFSSELKEKLSEYTTQKLKALTPKKLYEQATNIRFGEEISGTKARKLERSMSAKKAVETKRRLKEEREQREWERVHRDYIESLSISDYEEEYIPEFTDIVLSNIQEMIEDAKSQSWKQFRNNGYYVEAHLDAEIQTYGRDVVAQACENAGDTVISQARSALKSSTDAECHHFTTAMVMVIESRIPTIEESKVYTEQEDTIDAEYLQNEE